MARRRTRADIDFMPDLQQSMKRVGSRFAYILSIAVISFSRVADVLRSTAAIACSTR